MKASIKDKRSELVAAATAMLNGALNPIEGARKICELRYQVGDPDNEVFMPIRAIESETDHFPIGENRNQCAPDYLQRMDEEMGRYLADARGDITSACREIIRVYS